MAHWLLFTSPVCATTGWACTTGCTPRGHPLTFRSIPIDADAPEYASHEGRMAFPERRRRHWHQRLLTPDDLINRIKTQEEASRWMKGAKEANDKHA